jgi:hypothetical protein
MAGDAFIADARMEKIMRKTTMHNNCVMALTSSRSVPAYGRRING